MLRASWKKLPQGLRSGLSALMKGFFTFGAFYLLLNHSIEDDSGASISILDAISEHIVKIELSSFLPWVLLATAIKMVGIGASMLRWHLLLSGQGIRFNFGHIVGSFLIGRFLGTFLPSTVGLDGYKLYDAAKFSERVIEPAAATAIEKVMGLSGIFLSFLVAFPLGSQVLGETAGAVALIAVPLSLAVVLGLFTVLFKPGLVQWFLDVLPGVGSGKITDFVNRASEAAAAYRGRGALLAQCIGLSFVVHFTTAAMYYFTALAVGAVSADFWQVVFASSIQIFATVISPFTIAGEGVREIVQALLLAKHIGTSQSILSAALGFWAAEALTLVGGVFWWMRRDDYKPRVMELSLATDSGDEMNSAQSTPQEPLSSCS